MNKLNKITVICNEDHEITPGVCALCERDYAQEWAQCWERAVLELHGNTLWNSIHKRARTLMTRKKP